MPDGGGVYLFGGDKLARDIFSRMVYGSQIVLIIAPAATMFAIMVGVTLGLPAGYYGGQYRLDPVVPCQPRAGLPRHPAVLPAGDAGHHGDRHPDMAGRRVLPVPDHFLLGPVLHALQEPAGTALPPARPDILLGGWIYLGLVFDADPLGIVRIDPNQLNIFVAVVFASSPGVFRIVRGLVMDIKTRDYIAAAQTRGESPWYIMLWEILPNARGPLIVDACLRIGYTTILLGTLGYFGLGLAPESPDWGTAIKDASRLLRSFIHPALPPTIALMSFVLGLNLLADALREQSLKD